MKRRSLKLTLSTLVLAFAIVGLTGAINHNHELCQGFVPQNDLKIPVGTFSRGGLTEAQFNAVIDRAEKIYAPVILEKSKGKKLHVNRLWSDATVNASAQQLGGDWVVNMYGGLARHATITEEGFALVICYEIGHHIGGAPKVNGFLGMNAWASNEGQSDYFATLKCLREFFGEEDNVAFVRSTEIDPVIRNTCENEYSTEAEQALCMRISKAGESVAFLFQALRKEATPPSYSTPDTKEVGKTNDNHPDTQCRMDTYLAGLSCNLPLSEATSDTDAKVGACNQDTHKVGFRPRCWFQPNQPTQDNSCPLGDAAICEFACQISPNFPFCKSVTSSVYY